MTALTRQGKDAVIALNTANEVVLVELDDYVVNHVEFSSAVRSDTMPEEFKKIMDVIESISDVHKI